VKDRAEYARFSRRKVLGDVAVELIRLLDLGLRSVDQADELVALCRDFLGLVLLPRGDLAEGQLPRGNGGHLVADELHDVADCIIERFGAEEKHVFTRMGVLLARVGLVLEERRRVGDMRAGQKPNALVSLVAAEAQEETARALVVRRLERRDRETESRREGLAKGRKALQVERRVEAHELGARSLATVNGLDEGDLDVREASTLEDNPPQKKEKKKKKKEYLDALFNRRVDFTYDEDLVDGISSSDGSVVGKRARQDGDGDDKIADQRRVARIGISERIDRVPLDLERVERVNDGPRSLEPGRLDRVVVDGARGANDLLRVGTAGDRPLRSRLEDAGRSGPVEVGDGVGVRLGQAAPVIFGDEIGLGAYASGRGDEGAGGRVEGSRERERALRRRR
jgi:hypothetical protein